MNTFVVRSLSATVFVIIMLAGMLWTVNSFAALFFCIAVFSFYEYLQLIGKIHPDFHQLPLGLLFLSPLVLCGLFLILSGEQGGQGFESYFHIGLWLTAAIGSLFLILVLANRFPATRKSILLLMLGLIYTGLAPSMLLNLRIFKSFQGFPLIPLMLIGSIWINDTMAYLVGSVIGRTAFFPAISPKKTWEGTLGGIVLCIALAAAAGHLLHIYRLQDWIIISFLAAVTGTAGDLLESKLKRLAMVKDSGSIMPGHGGFLDRFDSLLLATPAVFLYVWLFM